MTNNYSPIIKLQNKNAYLMVKRKKWLTAPEAQVAFHLSQQWRPRGRGDEQAVFSQDTDSDSSATSA